MITKASVTTTATIVSAAKKRRVIVMQNQSDTDIYIAPFGDADVTGAAGAKPGLKLLAAGGVMPGSAWDEFSPDMNYAVYAIHEGIGSKTLVIHEDPS